MLVRGRDQADEGRNGSTLYHSRRLIRCPGRNVSQSPGRLKLDGGTVCESQEGDKLWDQSNTDQLVDGRVFVTGQELPEIEDKNRNKVNIPLRLKFNYMLMIKKLFLYEGFFLS